MKKREFFVLDCSMAIAWILPDDKMNEKADEVLSLLDSMGAKVPTIWPLEVINVLSLAERQKKLTAVEVAEFKEFISLLPIEIDNSTSLRAMGSIHTLAITEQLTSYDASYLEIAMRENLPLASFDKELKKAAQRNNVRLF